MSSIKVKVEQGVVRGCEEILPNGKIYHRFSGIPYAKPPIGELRFKSPQKLEKFDQGEINCTQERDACFHKSPFTAEYIGSEDCLNLNIYVPVSDCPFEKMSTMFYIHGGGFKYGSNSIKLYSPEHLLMENVIVVTINYRLHVLGFITMPSVGVSGNMGLKDQQRALEWIYENISNFNGDPEKICLFGNSGGSASVHFQVMNPKSRKFISSAICQSGTVMNDWAFYGQTEETAVKLANIISSRCESVQEAYETLMSTPIKILYDNCDKVLSFEDLNACIRNKWRIVIEEESDDAFITQASINSIYSQKGKINFPMMFGTLNGDGMPEIASIIARKRINVYDEKLEYMIPRSLKISSTSAAKELAVKMRNLYFKGQRLSENRLEELIMMRTDVDYFIPLTLTNELFAQYQPGCKQFLYEFQFNGKLNLQKKQMKMENLTVAGHGDETFYIFGSALANQVLLEENSKEWRLRKTVCKLWTNFAKYLDPTPDHDNPLSFKWNPVQPIAPGSENYDLDYLIISDEFKMVQNINKERKDFWRDSYKIWNDEFSKAKL